MLLADFSEKHRKDNKVVWDFWMTSSSDRALDFLEDSRSLQESFGDSVEFTPHFVFWECHQCATEYLENDCFGGGKYCAVEPSNQLVLGVEIIQEDLR